MAAIKPALALMAALMVLAGVPSTALARHFRRNRANLYGLYDTTVIIIRPARAAPTVPHAQKPASLSPPGNARALAYARYFQTLHVDRKLLRPGTLIAATAVKQGAPPAQTIEPLAHALGLPVNTRFGSGETKKLVHWLKAEPHASVVLICWQRDKIPKLIHALGGNASTLLPDGEWPAGAYSWLVVLHYNRNAQLVGSQRVEERLVPGD